MTLHADICGENTHIIFKVVSNNAATTKPRLVGVVNASLTKHERVCHIGAVVMRSVHNWTAYTLCRVISDYCVKVVDTINTSTLANEHEPLLNRVLPALLAWMAGSAGRTPQRALANLNAS